MIRHRAVLGSQAVDDRSDSRIGLLELLEEVRVFQLVVEVNDAAVAQAGRRKLPEHALVLERVESIAHSRCGKSGDHLHGELLNGGEIAKGAAEGDPDCITVFEKFLDRFARSLATLVNVLDPDAIVLGGGLSNIEALYAQLPVRVERYAFTPEGPSLIVKNRHGDSSGVRGAAWLWPAAKA